MARTRTPALLVLLLAVLAFGPADTARTEDAPAAPTLADCAFIAGHWRSEKGTMHVEELWMQPRGGLMLGLNRTSQASPPGAEFEYLRIEKRPDGIHYLASPGGRSPVSFRLTEHGDRRAVFTNPSHDFPQRIEYRILEDGSLQASATTMDGEGPSWTWKPVGKID